MDYSGREDFRHLLLQATAVIALLTGASGMLLWSLRAVRAFRSLLAARARVAKVG